MSLPQVVPQDQWATATQGLLANEKEATRALDALAAERRRLPMAKIEKQYAFDGPRGKATLLDLFEGRRQLIVYHFHVCPRRGPLHRLLIIHRHIAELSSRPGHVPGPDLPRLAG